MTKLLAGYCNKIDVNILPDNVVEVIDNGRGIPTDINVKYQKTAVEIVLTVLHAGGKFKNDSYSISGGLHGVGVSVVNALSEWLEVTVRRDGKIYQQRYERGKPVTELEIVGDTTERGTTVKFKADHLIFETLIYEYSILATRLKELAYLNLGLTINLSDSRTEPGKKKVFTLKGA